MPDHGTEETVLCNDSGGYWVPGSIANGMGGVTVYSDTGWITAKSDAGVGLFASACSQAQNGCGSDVLDPETGLSIPYSASSFGDSGIVAPGQNWFAADAATGQLLGLVPVNAQTPTPPAPPTIGPAPPGIGPDPLACSPYLDGTGAGQILFNLCSKVFPNGPWSNCVRGQLLNQYVQNGNPFQLGWYLFADHLYDFAACVGQ